jgi:large subunit ribosomal protein L35
VVPLGATATLRIERVQRLDLVIGVLSEATAGQQDGEFITGACSSNQEGAVMPKMKTKSSAKKRFRVRPGGTVKRGQAFKRHILTKKTTKNKRHLRGTTSVHETNMGHIAQMLPFAGL